ncbi:MAG: DUF4258 domain-containing protein [Saprospiraceae bacterium]
MNCQQVIYREHAIKRMFERNITAETVEEILANGEVIKDYPDDKPFASCLLLGYKDGQPIHIVASEDQGICYVITVYEPDSTIWNKDFKTKRI